LGGFELFSNPRDNDAVLYVGKEEKYQHLLKHKQTLGGLLPGPSAIACPEVKKLGWSSLKECAKFVIVECLTVTETHF
jgi:hypothetical protein